MGQTEITQMDVKSFDSPDEVRPFEGKGQSEVINVGGHTIARGTFEPGWRWSENIKPIAGTDSCQVFHVSYILSGRMRVFMDDGSEGEVGPGDVMVIPPGHNAEVIGDEPCVALEFGEASKYAQRS